jgi:very-short-patch-repair endonuclease
VNPALRALLASADGMVGRADALRCVNHDVLDRAVSAGRLVQVFPRVYVDPARPLDRERLIRAALRYAGDQVAVSHVSGLALWRLPVPESGPVHLTTADTRHLRGAPGLVVHRRDVIDFESSNVVVRAGCPVLRLESCLVDSWPLLDGDARRAPVIMAIAQRMTTVRRVRDALEERLRLGGRRLFVRLLDLLDRGCRSELELWGYTQVFRGFGLHWQVRVMLDGRAVYLDVYDEVAKVNFELDGRKYHGSVRDRERDLRRDAALAARGIMVVRFTHDRLVREPGAVRAQVAAILAARRSLVA